MNNNIALMVIDVQKGLFELDDPVYQGEALLQRINDVIDRARAAKVPIVFVQHSDDKDHPLDPEKPGWNLHPDLLHPVDEDIIIHKTEPDSFYETTLESELKARGIQRLVMTGLQSEVCVNATSRRAAKLGYDVTVIQDAHSTYDTADMSAAEIIAARNQAFADEKIAHLITTDSVGDVF